MKQTACLNLVPSLRRPPLNPHVFLTRHLNDLALKSLTALRLTKLPFQIRAYGFGKYIDVSKVRYVK